MSMKEKDDPVYLWDVYKSLEEFYEKNERVEQSCRSVSSNLSDELKRAGHKHFDMGDEIEFAVYALSLSLMIERYFTAVEEYNKRVPNQLLYAQWSRTFYSVSFDEIIAVFDEIHRYSIYSDMGYLKDSRSLEFACQLNRLAVLSNLEGLIEMSYQYDVLDIHEYHRKVSDDDLLALFNEHKEFYLRGHRRAIEAYVERANTKPTPLDKLERDFEDKAIVQLFKKNPEPVAFLRTIEHKYVENDLLPLFDYIIKYDLLSAPKASQLKATKPSCAAVPQTPLKLTAKQKRVLSFAAEQGMVEGPDQEGCYHWMRSDALLSYFIGCLFCGDTSTPGGANEKPSWLKGNKRLDNAALSALFNVKNIGKSRRDRQTPPQGFEEIDALMKL